MSLIRHRNSTSIIILMVAVYAAAFLLHDLAYCPPPIPADLMAETEDRFDSQGRNGSADGDTRVRPAQESHHCPFCNGFTGSVGITLLPPPAGDNGKPPLPPSRLDHGETLFSSIARAPPMA